MLLSTDVTPHPQMEPGEEGEAEPRSARSRSCDCECWLLICCWYWADCRAWAASDAATADATAAEKPAVLV